MKHVIALLEGDGVGPEMMEATRSVLEHLSLEAEYIKGEVGLRYKESENACWPQKTREMMKGSQCALLGPFVCEEKDSNGMIDGMNGLFELYAHAEHYRFSPGISPTPCFGSDVAVFRHNWEGKRIGTSGIDSGDLRFALEKEYPQYSQFANIDIGKMGWGLEVFTQQGCHALMDSAFKYAIKQAYPLLCVLKSWNSKCAIWTMNEAIKLQKSFPALEIREMEPQDFFVWFSKEERPFVALIPDALSGAMEGICRARYGEDGSCRANVGKHYGIFMPGGAHIVGMLYAAAMMLRFLGEGEKAFRMEQAVGKALAEGNVDLGKTQDVIREVRVKLGCM